MYVMRITTNHHHIQHINLISADCLPTLPITN